MKVIQIDKEKWADGLNKAAESYRLFGPVKEEEFHNFKELAKGESPDLGYLNSRLSPKSIIYPQSEAMFEYSLDESAEDHHIMKEVDKDYSLRAVIGIRPCDAKAFVLVNHNFDTPEYKDPYWMWSVVCSKTTDPPTAEQLTKKGISMKIFSISKDDWSNGLTQLAKSYRLFGPVKEEEFHNFKELAKGESPDLSYLNSRLSPKSIIYPQSEVMFEYSLDESAEDHHIMKEVDKDYSQRAVIGIRPCDAKAFVLVNHNFDTPEYKDPYWIKACEATTLVGLACEAPCSSCFCTTAGCGPYHEEGLDVLLVDAADHYLAKILTEKGQKLVNAAGWDTAVRCRRCRQAD